MYQETALHPLEELPPPARSKSILSGKHQTLQRWRRKPMLGLRVTHREPRAPIEYEQSRGRVNGDPLEIDDNRGKVIDGGPSEGIWAMSYAPQTDRMKKHTNSFVVYENSSKQHSPPTSLITSRSTANKFFVPQLANRAVQSAFKNRG
ncbi:hypothetical protein FRB94_010441 [Tulasnella sp. JGI-2019a]|nr:hypothetical protein FRB93_013871 [Tulasnella sp. JGI-2019a]KAG9010478.1 hypothetical protein FRB94_010441 [Tulasnella sp. JGI-2019a]KAG9039888.1 hypothetical protein FRB95_004360 [Tulasnella sp. JGI-2019a]